MENIRTGWETEVELVKIRQAMEELSGKPLFIDDTPSLSMWEMRAKSRQHAHKHGKSVIVVDYLQLMRGSKNMSRYQELGEISRGLKQLAPWLSAEV